MGFSSHADFVLETNANGKKGSIDVHRTIQTGATSAIGRWHECMSAGGGGGVMTLTGAAGVGIAMNRSTAGALPLNADVSTDTRHLIAGFATTSSTVVGPATVLLTDIIHIYPSCSVVTTPTVLSNHPVWTGTGDTRMTNAIGVQAACLLTTAGTAAGQITPTYRNQAGTAGRTTAAPQGSFFSTAAAHPAGGFLSTGLAALGTGAMGGLNMPFAVGDTGVQEITSYAINTNITSGAACFILHRPIAKLPLAAAGALSMADFYTLGLPRIYDNSCLAAFVLVGAATTTGQTIQIEGTYGWG